jgi:hypothetical protein
LAETRKGLILLLKTLLHLMEFNPNFTYSKTIAMLSETHMGTSKKFVDLARETNNMPRLDKYGRPVVLSAGISRHSSAE